MSSTPDAVHHRVRQEVAARTDLLWEVASALACTAVDVLADDPLRTAAWRAHGPAPVAVR
ncbi:hypothetical protein ABZ722_20295 [Streptomyces longwoodensis]|uniref:hypothetical protein n=1 Tax=Streptomyces longwoodensis TaxID=68231 RepID=UPI003406947C